MSERTWLAHRGAGQSVWRTVAKWRALDGDVHLMDSTKRRRMDLPIDEYARRAADHGIDTINMPARQWSSSDVAAVHAAGLKAFGFRAHSRSLSGAVSTSVSMESLAITSNSWCRSPATRRSTRNVTRFHEGSCVDRSFNFEADALA